MYWIIWYFFNKIYWKAFKGPFHIGKFPKWGNDSLSNTNQHAGNYDRERGRERCLFSLWLYRPLYWLNARQNRDSRIKMALTATKSNTKITLPGSKRAIQGFADYIFASLFMSYVFAYCNLLMVLCKNCKRHHMSGICFIKKVWTKLFLLCFSDFVSTETLSVGHGEKSSLENWGEFKECQKPSKLLTGFCKKLCV